MMNSLTQIETIPVGDEDRIIPTRLAKIKDHMDFLDKEIAAMIRMKADSQIDFDLLVKRAKECNVTTDEDWKIVEAPVYPKKRVDVEKLKHIAPDKYDLIIANIQSRISDKIESEMGKAATFISQSDVKTVIRDKAVLAMVIPEPSEIVGYEISLVKR